jgi:hypothetical protein
MLIISPFAFCSTFCLTDRTGRSVSVNLYNLAPGKGVIIGDSVAIAEPYFTHVRVETGKEEKGRN